MRKLILPLLCLGLLCGCGVTTAERARPWPTHAPGATPYVRLQEEPSPEPAENEVYGSYEELMRSLFAQEGNFFFKEGDLELFRKLPQNEPYRFVVHLEPMWDQDSRIPASGEERYRIQEEVQLEYCMREAEFFSDKGCSAEVRSMKGFESGVEYRNFITVITAEPELLFALSYDTEELYLVEPLYSTVEERYAETVWSSEA